MNFLELLVFLFAYVLLPIFIGWQIGIPSGDVAALRTNVLIFLVTAVCMAAGIAFRYFFGGVK